MLFTKKYNRGFAPLAALIVIALFCVAFLFIYARNTIQSFSLPKTSVEQQNTGVVAFPAEDKQKSGGRTAPAQEPTKKITTDLPQLPRIIEEPLQKIEEKIISLPKPLKLEYRPGDVELRAETVVQLTNAERSAQGLPALKSNAVLAAAAQAKLDDMFDKQYFAHVSPDGVQPSEVVKSSGYAFIITGENLAWGNFLSDKDLVTAWMNSPGHRANILHESFQEIGIAVGKGLYEGKEVWMAVQEFGVPASACSTPDASLHSQIVSKKADLTEKALVIGEKLEVLETTDPSTDPYYRDKQDEYNLLVSEYKSAEQTVSQLIKTYNAQVSAYNECRAQFVKE